MSVLTNLSAIIGHSPSLGQDVVSHDAHRTTGSPVRVAFGNRVKPNEQLSSACGLSSVAGT